MVKTITLTDLIITNIEINYLEQNVRVTYNMVDDDGVNWEAGLAYFWVTMPSEPRDNDFLLPPSYLPTLVSLKNDADIALTNKFLV